MTGRGIHGRPNSNDPMHHSLKTRSSPRRLCPNNNDPMHHSLKTRTSPRRLLRLNDQPATKKKSRFQGEEGSSFQFYSQGASDVPKQQRQRQLDLTPPRPSQKRKNTAKSNSLIGVQQNSHRSSSSSPSTNNDRFGVNPSQASSLPNLNAGVLRNTSQRSQTSRPGSPSPEMVDHSPGGSNLPHELNDDCGTSRPRRFVKRGITRMIKALAKQHVKRLLPRVGVFNGALVGDCASELIASLGVWSRQRENFPLSTRLFKNMPSENIERVSQMARDHYELVPDDEATEAVLRNYMKSAYVNYRASLSKHFRIKCKGDLQIALATPPENCENKEDWIDLCHYFNTPAVVARSNQAIEARKKQVLNHTSGTQSYTRRLFHRREKGLPIDPVTMFKETHKDEKGKLPPICEQWKKEMDDLLEKKDRGEIDCSPEEIYHNVVDPTRLGCKRRRKQLAFPPYYSRTDEQLSAVQKQLDAANKKIARMRQHGSKLIKLLNVTFQNLGQDLLPEDILDPNEDSEIEVENHGDGQYSEEEEEEEIETDEELGGGQ